MSEDLDMVEAQSSRTSDRQWHTLDEMVRLCGDASAQVNPRFIAIGIGLESVVGGPVDDSKMPVGQFLARLEHSIDRARVAAVSDRFGQCCGYAHCAAVGQQWRAPALKFGPQALGPGALADRGELFILDFRPAPGMLGNSMSHLRDGPLRPEHSAIYLHCKNSKRLSKRISRADGSGFAKMSESVGRCDAEPFLLSHKASGFFLPATRAFTFS